MGERLIANLEDTMLKRIALALLIAGLSLAAVACSTPAEPAAEPEPIPPVEAPTDSPAAGLRLAPGLYDLEDGTAQAVGTLEYRDLEGGFWAIIGGTEGEGNVGEVVAVIANGADFEDELKPLEGKSVFATGKRLDGASVRMAGPEFELAKIEEVSDTPGIAE